MLENLPEGITEELLIYALIAVGLFVLAWLFFGYTIYSTLKLIKKENQCILPNQAWFVALPFFNIYWNFEVVKRLADSLNNEFYDRQIETEENPTRRAGQMFAWSFLITNIPLPAMMTLTVRLLSLVYFVTYWVKVAQHKRLLKLHIAHYGMEYTAIEKEENEN